MAKRKLKVFEQLKESLEDALAFEKGAAVNLRVAEIPPPPPQIAPREIRRIRASLHASQPRFALLLNVSAKAVQSWEQGVRRPQAAALKLLAIAKNNPRALLEA
jgi:DNA-binding transcriptional regulator YiaG